MPGTFRTFVRGKLCAAADALLGLHGLAQSAKTPELAHAVPPLHAVESLTEYRLANGFHILLIPNGFQPTVTVNRTILEGSRHERSGETVMARLPEHLLFKGRWPEKSVPIRET